jgi:hypothetical protein
MAVSEAIAPPNVGMPSFGVTVDYLRHWCVICDQFNEWQQKHIIGGHPTAQEQDDHRQSLKWLLRLTKLMHYTASDPEFPDRSLAQLLDTKIWQLEQTWKLLYRRLSPRELEDAEDVLTEVFPNEPGT